MAAPVTVLEDKDKWKAAQAGAPTGRWGSWPAAPADQVSQGRGQGPAAGTEGVTPAGRGNGRHRGVGEKGLQLRAEPSWGGSRSGAPFQLGWDALSSRPP